jgi:hypothetical protein
MTTDHGLAAEFSALQAIAQEGAVVIVKIDGERIVAGIPEIYTVMVSGGALARDDYYRGDGSHVTELMAKALSYYRSKVAG